jgi:G3E family GTPase
MKKTRVDMLFGFLGSGKTTLAARILNEYGTKRRLALIVNEFGDVGVDGEILKGNNIDVVQLSTGCLCCTLKGSLEAAVLEIGANSEIDHIIIEATGVAEPEEVMASFMADEFVEKFEVGPIVTVVDAPKFIKIRTMLGPFYEAQIEKSDYVILNKLDMANTSVFNEVQAEIEEINPDAILRFAERCDVDLNELMDGPPSQALELCQKEEMDDDPIQDHSHGHSHALHAPANSFVIEIPNDINRDNLLKFYASAPKTLWRSKGFVRIDGVDHLVQVVMGDVEITPTTPRERQYLVFIGDGIELKSFDRYLRILQPKRAAKR